VDTLEQRARDLGHLDEEVNDPPQRARS
jgi:hypothetical protein